MIDQNEMLAAKDEMAETDMRRVKELIEKAQGLKAAIEGFEENLNEMKEDHRILIEVDLPQAMQQCGLDTFGNAELGVDVELENKVDAKIPQKFEEQAYGWLQDNGHGSLIKSILQVSFDKGEYDKLQTIIDAAATAGLPTEGKRSIHASTLKSFVKSMLEDGKELPLEYFGVFQRTVAKIKPRKP